MLTMMRINDQECHQCAHLRLTHRGACWRACL